MSHHAARLSIALRSQQTTGGMKRHSLLLKLLSRCDIQRPEMIKLKGRQLQDFPAIAVLLHESIATPSLLATL